MRRKIQAMPTKAVKAGKSRHNKEIFKDLDIGHHNAQRAYLLQNPCFPSVKPLREFSSKIAAFSGL